MKELLNLSVAKLKRLAALKTKIERLQSQLEAVVANVSSSSATAGRKRRKMSAAARRKISLAAKARWAKVRAGKSK
ncbi:MAG TPA: hypothetical protein VG077_19180 [Verrucomicrobiae bacterium]|nr:hypothetical protein [Verrucomicrobiae bacterium]